MRERLLKGTRRTVWSISALCLLAGGLMVAAHAFSAETRTTISPSRRIEAFQPGESLTYNVSWSNAVKAGTAVLEVFDHARRRVVSRLNDDPPETLAIPDQVQDALSALYYLRTRNDFVVDKPIVIEVFDGGTSRSIEVLTLGREKVKTPVGEFNAIKIRASGGIFLGEGKLDIWLTDDSRKVPVLIKSRIAIGSIVFTLKDLKSGQLATRAGGRLQN